MQFEHLTTLSCQSSSSIKIIIVYIYSSQEVCGNEIPNNSQKKLLYNYKLTNVIKLQPNSHA